MLSVTHMAGFGSGLTGITLMQAITDAGLTANLQLCLDAADSASYTSGTKWSDRSGNGFDFFLGSDATGTADPTFNGQAGSMDQFTHWSFDGTQYFTYDTTNETWMQNLHKNNAAFTFLFALYLNSSASIFGTDGAGATTGILATISAASDFTVSVKNAGAGVATMGSGTIPLVDSKWHIFAVSVDEAAGTGFLYSDGVSESVVTTYTAPAAGNASFTMQLAAIGNGSSPIVAGNLLSCLAAWSTPLSAAQVDSIFTRIRGRFGI